jgi:hypothetical protein
MSKNYPPRATPYTVRNSSNRIKQGVAKITLQDKSYYWIRISRAYHGALVTSLRKIPFFYYAKIYEIVDYKKGERHKIGGQLGFITLTGSRFF